MPSLADDPETKAGGATTFWYR